MTTPAQAGVDAGFLNSLPAVRGRLVTDAPLAPITWFRVGGPAQVLFTPADGDDLSHFLAALAPEIPLTIIGIGSNLLVRDGGVPGVVVRLGRGFSAIEILENNQIAAGAAVPDVKVARCAADASLAGLAFLRGIPGCVGGALRMNGGAYGGEVSQVLVRADAVARDGTALSLTNSQMGFSYRHSAAGPVIFTRAIFQGRPGTKAEIAAEMKQITTSREASQPVRSRTGGSTFKNPDGAKAWELIDAAGCRGLQIGGAQVSEKHCNFLINTGSASAQDIETLGETVRARVLANSGFQLEWEIQRIGVALADGGPDG
ncbi:MAG: UDP-N-acetylmuramate dehydrogenase [Alphaproteobacteria bacterium]